jgi:Arm DNA-binding domain/Phage integrase family
MAQHQLTDRAVKTAKPADKDRLIADGGGLFLRVLPTGFKSWLLVYGIHGKRRKLTLGNARDVSLAKARETAAQERARIAAGGDPRVALMEKQAAQTAQREALIAADIQRKREASTLRDLFDAWLTDGVQRADDNAELRRTFNKDILSHLGNVPVRAITDVELREALRRVGRSRGRGRTAARMLSETRQMYRWAIKRQPWKSLLSEGNPAELIDTKQVVPKGYEAGIRHRILNPAEIRELRNIFTATQNQYAVAEDRRSADRPLQRETQLALWLCLGTACRIGELLMARWEHIDLEAGTWFVPRGNTKTRVDWQVFLSDLHCVTSKNCTDSPARATTRAAGAFPPATRKDTLTSRPSLSKSATGRCGSSIASC